MDDIGREVDVWCKTCKWDEECICQNVFSEHYNESIDCNMTCSQYEEYKNDRNLHELQI